jgi:hypothetical protein
MKYKSLKSAFSRGEFGGEFIVLAKKELPHIWGRQNLLEEFYRENAPGIGERSRQIHEQLGAPKRFHGGSLRKLWAALRG